MKWDGTEQKWIEWDDIGWGGVEKRRMEQNSTEGMDRIGGNRTLQNREDGMKWNIEIASYETVSMHFLNGNFNEPSLQM